MYALREITVLEAINDCFVSISPVCYHSLLDRVLWNLSSKSTTYFGLGVNYKLAVVFNGPTHKQRHLPLAPAIN